MLILGFPIEFHNEIKNELFVKGHHILQFTSLKVFVIQRNSLQFYNGPLNVFWKVYSKRES